MCIHMNVIIHSISIVKLNLSFSNRFKILFHFTCGAYIYKKAELCCASVKDVSMGPSSSGVGDILLVNGLCKAQFCQF